ncbi:MAG TPA: flagellar biosynthetic protein FliO [Gammaproteobacteria bacterium]|nr:flagellar biosynthetic protein FliO [Gammaproteobacteria bacterium]
MLLKKNKIKRILFLFMSMVVSIDVLSAEEKDVSTVMSNDPMSGSYLLQLILGLVVVILCIVVLAWLARRMHRLQSSSNGFLKILGGLNMSARERVILLQVGDEQLLVGVSPGHINTLHVLNSPVDVQRKKSGDPDVNTFSEKLSAMLSASISASDKKAGSNEG